MLQPKTNTAWSFIDAILIQLPNNVYLVIYRVDKFYKLYFYLFGLYFDNLNFSFLWKNSKITNFAVTKYTVMCWRRLIFKGKGFRVRIFRYNKKITLNFGYSHWTKIKFIYNWDFFKLYRQNYLSFCNSWQDFSSFELFFPHIKPMNRYTLRGLRFKKQVIKRRFGKISQYISSLH